MFSGSLAEPRSSISFPVTAFWVGAPCWENVCIGAWMRRRRRMSASARATARRWALSSLHGAELLGVLAVAIAAGCLPLLLQPATTNPSTATASARAPVADCGSPTAGKGDPDILTELSGSPLLECSVDAQGRARKLPGPPLR